jgi:hypothetical protein
MDVDTVVTETAVVDNVVLGTAIIDTAEVN